MAMMHEPENSEPVDRLYVRLAAALRQSRPNPFGVPVTVAEIYQELVPYRLVRTDAGFGMNADYEHALLRLLAGEGECVRLEPSAARDAIRRELRSNNPNVGMYREYAGCDVWVTEPAFMPAPGSIFALADEDADDAANAGVRAGDAADMAPAHDRPSRTPDAGSASDAGNEPGGADEAWSAQAHESARGNDPGRADDSGRADEPRSVDSGADWLDDDEAGSQPGTAAMADDEADEADVSDESDVSDDAANCGFCDSPLPTHRTVRYCPWCGADQTMQPCSACGEPLEEGWLFCVACGARPGD